ncbi:hypothetical protein SAMN05446037_1009180 [Anaerovirgula multivorans]|uniref:Uncharacterized protein n=1 Tax=Anaerovirgula multivorans TaxID=312168 RepID=A0A239ED63_9FIRM|nr:hypothetical protein [Anaerovirgula multivorans]SNS42391.1 hypothetical protein SAMN05446037_1009180 [Anaerovirgula multivorans]
MTHDKMKAIKIVDELMSFYLKIGIVDIHIDFNYGEKQTEVHLRGECHNPPIKKLEKLETVLNTPRQPELEEYYWELVGNSDYYQEITLLGALVDSGEVDYSDHQLKVKVIRKR